MSEVIERLTRYAQIALSAVNGEAAVADYLAQDSVVYTHLIAVGKTACAMARGAFSQQSFEACLLVTKEGVSCNVQKHSNMTLLYSAHPIPDQSSLDAGKAVIDFMESAPDSAIFLILVSGGTSSMLEFLQPDISLSELIEANQKLLTASVDISTINEQRKRYSKVKSGGMIQFLKQRLAKVLLISDVHDGDVSIIGSGPWFDAKIFCPQHVVVADGQKAQDAVIQAAHEEGFPVTAYSVPRTGDIGSLQAEIEKVFETRQYGLHIWRGEVSVTLPEYHGYGGRCHHLGLLMTECLSQEVQGGFLALATDGDDGSTKRAGVVLDSKQARRICANVEIEKKRAMFDSGEVFNSMGLSLEFGQTDTNVADIYLAWVEEENEKSRKTQA